MKISRNGAAAVAVAVALLGAVLPALAQERPESLLPPGFGDPAPAGEEPSGPTDAPEPEFGTVPPPAIAATDEVEIGNVTAADEAAAEQEIALYEIPPYARRSLALVGVSGGSDAVFGADAFGRADGIYLEQLMRRIEAPLPSRWLSIALRRLLLAQLATPARVHGADFAAERAWLLLRMGEAPAARAIVQAVDTDVYTPKLYQVAMQAALANADPAALCGIADAASEKLPEPGWVLARAMCAGLSGEPGIGGPIIDGARRSRIAGGIDVLLAEKVMGAGSSGRRAVTIQWDGVDRLNAWRYGLATAVGLEIPPELFGTVNSRVQLWRATAPMVPGTARLEAAELAAARGVLSNLALVDLYSAVDDDGDDREDMTARDLRSAYTEGRAGERLSALRQLWGAGEDPLRRYGRLVLTARAAAALPVSEVAAEDSDRLVASMLAAGLDHRARRWLGQVERGSDAWAMLALADANPGARYAAGDVQAYDTDKAAVLFAGLAGLGRLSSGDTTQLAETLEVPLTAGDAWTRAIDRAAAAGQPGTVLLLAALGMQTSRWDRIPPAMLFHIVRGLRSTGLEGEARMIAAEAIARL